MSNAKLNRRAEIVRLVKERKHITRTELSREFGVTEETIRKDLQELSERGELMRTFGGAAIREYGNEKSLDQRIIQNLEEKQKIARAASELVHAGNLLVMDAGSTVTFLAKLLPPGMNVTVLTNSLEITSILTEREEVSVICTGGRFHKKSMSFQGILTENAIGTYNAEKAFISCSAFDVNLGVMDSNEEAARTKQKMIQMAREVYLLADSSKIGCIAHITTCSIGSLTGIVTDDGIPAKALQALENAGVRVIIAK